MPKNESVFKREFRKALEKEYGYLTHIWASNDMFRSGVPDFNATYGKEYFSIEAKYIKTLPSKKTSQVLTHKLSSLQHSHLSCIARTGCHGVVLIGMPDVAVACCIDDFYLKTLPVQNISLKQLKEIAMTQGMSFPKIKGQWQVQGFFEKIIGRTLL